MPAVLEVKKLRARSLDSDYQTITWELGDTTEDVLDYTFQIVRSESPEGPFEPISAVFEDHYSFVDNTLLRSNIYRQYHYKLLVTHKASGSVKEWGPISKEPEADLITTEIRTHINLLMREFAGRRCWVLPVRTFGQRCSACWNETLQKKSKSNCATCFDTTYVRGYLRPIESWIQIDPSSNANQHNALGPQQQQTTTARMGYYPQLKPRDLIVEGENRRWTVVQINSTEHNRASLHQEASIHMIPPTDMQYKVQFELTAALQNLYLSPSRNYTNPQNLESFQDEEVPDIFGIYPVAK